MSKLTRQNFVGKKEQMANNLTISPKHKIAWNGDEQDLQQSNNKTCTNTDAHAAFWVI